MVVGCDCDKKTGDFVLRCPTRVAADTLAAQGHDVYLYDFVHPPAESVNWPSGTHGLGAFHGAEVSSTSGAFSISCTVI